MGIKDKLLLFFSAITIITAVVFLMRDDLPSLGTEKQAPIARVDSYTNIVKKKAVGSLAWVDIENSRQLYNGEKLITHDNSYAIITYRDNATIKVSPNTLLKIDEKSNDVNIDLQSGFLSLDFKKSSKTEQQKINLKVGKENVAIDANKAKLVISNQDNKSNIILVEGEANILSNSKRLNLQKGEQVKIDKELDLNIEQAKILLKFPGDKKVIENPSPILSWASPVEAQSFSVTLSKDKGQKDIILKKDVNEEVMYVNELSPGLYYWSVKTTVGGKIYNSPLYSFKVVDLFGPDLISPEDKKIFTLSTADDIPSITLRWEKRQTDLYKVLIKVQNGEEKSFIARNTSLTLPDLSFGNYTWKVRSNIKNAKWSEEHSFHIKRTNYYKIKSPLPETLPLYMEEDRMEIMFDWNGKNTETYVLAISTNPKMDKEVVEKDIQGGKARQTFKKPGDYYWNVWLKSDPNFALGIQKLSLYRPTARCTRPAPLAKIILYEENQKIDFEWKIISEDSATHFLEISKDESFKTSHARILSQDTKAQATLSGPGIYYWRARPQSPPLFHTSSKTCYFEAIRSSTPKAPKIDKDYQLKLIDKVNESYEISWQKVLGAKKYVLEIFADKDMKKKLLQQEVEDNTYVWQGNRFGFYFYRVKAIDNWGQEGSFSGLGKLIAPIAPLAPPVD